MILSRIFSINPRKNGFSFTDTFLGGRKKKKNTTQMELCKIRNAEVRVRCDFSSQLDSGWNIPSWMMETNRGCLLIKWSLLNELFFSSTPHFLTDIYNELSLSLCVSVRHG